MKTLTGIYKIQNKYDGKAYIGRSNNILLRWQQHIAKGQEVTQLEDSFHFELYRHSDYFTFDILELCDESELDKKEQYWIEQFDSINNGYNKINSAIILTPKTNNNRPTQKQIVDKINSLVGRPLTREDKESLSEFFNIRDTRGRLKKWSTIKKIIIENGLSVIETKRKNQEGKIVNCSIISVDWKEV